MKRKLLLLSLLSVLSYCIASAQYITEKDFKRYEISKVIDPNSGIAREPGLFENGKPYFLITNQYILINHQAPSFQGYTEKYQYRGTYKGNLVYQRWVEPTYFRGQMTSAGYWDENTTWTVSADLKTINYQYNSYGKQGNITVYKLITSDKIGSMYE